MRLIKPLLLVVSPLSSLVAAKPIHPDDVQGRDLFKVNPGLDKRTLFNVEHIESAERRKFLQDAQKEAVDIAVVALKNFDNPKYRGYLTAWFGRDPKGHPGEVDDDVRGVLTNFVGDNANGEGSVVLSGVTVWQDDYLPVRPKWCDKIDKEGRSATAYYSPTRKGGLGPSMHYCDKFFDRKNKADFLANNCASIANHIDTATTTRQYRGANVLHEFMHYGKVSEGQVGAQVDDLAYGAYNCLKYKETEESKDYKSRPTLNADTYVFFALHIWLSEECKKDFSYPRGPQDN